MNSNDVNEAYIYFARRNFKLNPRLKTMSERFYTRHNLRHEGWRIWLDPTRRMSASSSSHTICSTCRPSPSTASYYGARAKSSSSEPLKMTTPAPSAQASKPASTSTPPPSQMPLSATSSLHVPPERPHPSTALTVHVPDRPEL
ncbi:hypothetical protein BC936DRAFT_145371 [Jimgerdemannia flammicorona]|uniref:Uncharacterized protein n=1 Tax=Jimgerdemannia flammicorona TaxID=994334 RepID=A0A433DA46_9FUNG|nr:hypothetical protein BC936DRAFT_145371 [Jimgerdemannia flammicorona]